MYQHTTLCRQCGVDSGWFKERKKLSHMYNVERTDSLVLIDAYHINGDNLISKIRERVHIKWLERVERSQNVCSAG